MAQQILRFVIGICETHPRSRTFLITISQPPHDTEFRAGELFSSHSSFPTIFRINSMMGMMHKVKIRENGATHNEAITARPKLVPERAAPSKLGISIQPLRVREALKIQLIVSSGDK